MRRPEIKQRTRPGSRLAVDARDRASQQSPNMSTTRQDRLAVMAHVRCDDPTRMDGLGKSRTDVPIEPADAHDPALVAREKASVATEQSATPVLHPPNA